MKLVTVTHYHVHLMPSSHRRHRQDKTVTRQDCLVLSCQRCELNWRQSRAFFNILQIEQFCPVSSAVWTHLRTSLDPISKYDVTIGNHVVCESETGPGQDKTQFTPHFETAQNCFEIFSRRQSWLVANSVHTMNTDKTRQNSLVLSVSAVWTRHYSTNQPAVILLM